MIKCQKHTTCGIFLKRGMFKDIKNYIFMCSTHKYKNTNTEIQHMTKCQKNPICGIFLKRGMFKGIKNHIAIQHKLKHLSFAQLYEVQFQQSFQLPLENLSRSCVLFSFLAFALLYPVSLLHKVVMVSSQKFKGKYRDNLIRLLITSSHSMTGSVTHAVGSRKAALPLGNTTDGNDLFAPN